MLQTLLFNVVTNPVKALLEANYIGILAWAIGLGIAMRHANESTKSLISDVSHGVSAIVKAVIRCAPLGILGLVASTLAETGFDALFGYAQLLVVLIGCMLFIAFVVNPLIVFWKIKRNPYPLVLTCLKESGVTAFFPQLRRQHSGQHGPGREAAPAGRHLCGLHPAGGHHQHGRRRHHAITVLSMAAVHTLGMEVDMATAILLSVVATISACGASGVAGGSLLLIPLACSLFGISNDIAMQVVAVGFIIGCCRIPPKRPSTAPPTCCSLRPPAWPRMRACWMPPGPQPRSLIPDFPFAQAPSSEGAFICARVRRPAPSRRVMALTVLGSCVISGRGPLAALRVLATANKPFPVPACPALHSAGHIGLFVLSAWRPVASLW